MCNTFPSVITYAPFFLSATHTQSGVMQDLTQVAVDSDPVSNDMDDYGVPDLRQLMASSSRNQFCTTLQFSEPFSGHRNLTPIAPHYQYQQQHQQQPIVVGHELVPSIAMSSTSAANNGVITSSVASLYGLPHQLEYGWNINVNGIVSNDGDSINNNTSRWPRQETLTLLEIRSALDSKFKETNQKGPLWEDVSRIMAEEHGYQRSGKKCKEKFENLYKYYKKTKEGKAGRQDGKHYRFFRQLDAIYGKTTNSSLYDHMSTQNYDTINQESQQVALQDQKLSDSLSTYSTHEFETSSTSENNDHDHDHFSAIDFMMNQSVGKLENGKQTFAKVKKSWKAKMEEFVNSEMRKVIEKQEAWMEKMLKSVEDREEESLAKEEERRKQESARLGQQVHGFWAKERAWIEARDAAIMEALCKFTGKGSNNNNRDEDDKDGIRKEIANETITCHGWTEHEVGSLIQLRTLIQESGYLKEGVHVWEEIAEKMGCLGYNRRVEECKEKWENVSSSVKCEDDDIVKTSMYFGQVLLSSYELGSQQEVSKQSLKGTWDFS